MKGEMEQEDAKTRRFEDCSKAVIGACIEVHRHLGPGLLESAYEHCVAHELGLRALRFERQRPVPLEYRAPSSNAATASTSSSTMRSLSRSSASTSFCLSTRRSYSPTCG